MVNQTATPVPADPVEWTAESVRLFWGRFDELPDSEYSHFSFQRGAAVLKFVKKHVHLSGPALDLGCASGRFLDYMAARGICCVGADVTVRSLAVARQRLSGRPGFLGVVGLSGQHSLPFKTGSFEAVFLLETVEHLSGDHVGKIMDEIGRILRVGGRIIVTTPYDENLAAHTIVCPVCRRSFHQVQHLRSFNRASLKSILSDAGFAGILCSSAPLLPDMHVWLTAQRRFRKTPAVCPACGAGFAAPPVGGKQRIIDLYREFRHLICVAEKPDSMTG